MWHGMYYKAIPRIMVITLAQECANWLNIFPPKKGISEYYSPKMIMERTSLDYGKHCTTVFGQYVQALNENMPTNSMKERTIGCIYLCPMPNQQPGFKFMNLKTGKIITRRKYYEIPITKAVIDKVEELAK